ncbi:uncharacterized protein B0P05DRAFT_591351 [Gilbertella persicaria]|uniref:uncharacterized protein n=1 Tax=Gilbertella persicaria TaxID=101096 RepID=UPI00221FDA29|nr:uncharacterized protein B0P05DRAFT_591351 [Gilbertella persicaria]KAI8056282.1 hypothetical protein B0P05DRAFT_591351 [Gilbertella persicaria]
MVHRELPVPKTRMLSTWKLKDMIRKKELIMDAPYQRAVVWESAKMSELVDSILNNYYIPPLLFATRKIRGKQTRIVIDGKQRLTSMRRFMRNLIPYVDSSSGEPVSTYYADMTDTEKDNEEESTIRRSKPEPKSFLNEDLLDKFNSYEFVCVEYSDISEDDEYEIFSRVQLGVAITSAERLRAHNTHVAKLCRQLSQEHAAISDVLQRKKTADLFQMIAHLLLALKNDPKEFKGSNRPLVEFVSGSFHPPPALISSLKHVLHIFTSIVQHEDYRHVFTKRDGHQCAMKALEFLTFGKYVSLVSRPRSVSLFAKDFTSLRDYLFERREGKFYLGHESFNDAMTWVEQHIANENLAPSVQPQYNTISSDEEEDDDEMNDELKMDEYEHESAYTPYNSSSYNTATKRRREESLIGVPVARRGGKLPSGPPRR